MRIDIYPGVSITVVGGGSKNIVISLPEIVLGEESEENGRNPLDLGIQEEVVYRRC